MTNETTPLHFAGLTPEEHGELNTMPRNKNPDELQKRLAELRAKYAENVLALQQIGVYDPDGLYIKNTTEYVKAVIAQDLVKMAELE